MSAPAHRPAPAHTSWRRRALWAAALLALAAVFGLYQRPDFLVMLADQAWACFWRKIGL